jgi:hypothetical protein
MNPTNPGILDWLLIISCATFLVGTFLWKLANPNKEDDV